MPIETFIIDYSVSMGYMTYNKDKYKNDALYREKINKYNRERNKRKYHDDVVFREKALKRSRLSGNGWDRKIKKETCGILKKHASEMKDDPEHLTTEFLQEIIGIKCKDKSDK